MKDGDMI